MEETTAFARRASLLVVLTLPFCLVSGAMALPLGDSDCDGCVTDGDIDAFVQALIDPDGFALAYPGCDIGNADTNNDTLTDSADIQNMLLILAAPGIPTTTQLAGNSLPGYPHFEYVRAFNTNAAVELAIDPTRFPVIVGRNAEIYVVNAKTDADWNTDNTLSDVRGASQPVTFSPGTIQANTFTIAAAGQLASSAGTTELGRSYDVVIDFNLNGLLDCGDFIDGLGDPESGLYVIHDVTATGPLATTTISYAVTGVTGGFANERTVYPAGIASMGLLPLVVISHGNGHQYTWYDYLQQHLASYGYIVMSHQNNTNPGIESASTTTLGHTQAIIGQQAAIAGGVLNGHIDSHKIIWIGHSRGGEGVARAYDRIFDGSFVPSYFVLGDILLVSSIAPTDFLGPASANPHGVTYHLLYGASDRDVGGYPNNDIADSFNLYERATGKRQSTYLHGTYHNDFNCCGDDSGFSDGTSNPPGTLIGRTEAQRVTKGVYLALIKHYINASIPAKDFLWRQYERFKPIGVAATTVVDSEYKEGPIPAKYVIDDYQANTSLTTSSSGGLVVSTVTNLAEGALNDSNTSFAWTTSDPFNGMVRAQGGDSTRGAVFDWTSGDDKAIEFEIVPAGQDFRNRDYISFRACQGTRHPETAADLGDLTFTVTLRDVNGISSSINLGVYGGGIEEPYQRTGFGTGAGWQNEFETVRIRITDFLNNGTGLDLSRITVVQLRFGAAWGASRGRIGFDDLVLVPE